MQFNPPPPGPGRHSSHALVERSVVLTALAPGPGQVVLDLGCGRGEWARELAARVAPGGRVLAVDRWAEALHALARLPITEGVRPLRADLAAALPCADTSVDRVLAALVWHHLPPPFQAGLAQEVARVLKPSGRLVLIEFAPVPPPPGPPLAQRLEPRTIERLLAVAGLLHERHMSVADHICAHVARRP